MRVAIDNSPGAEPTVYLPKGAARLVRWVEWRMRHLDHGFQARFAKRSGRVLCVCCDEIAENRRSSARTILRQRLALRRELRGEATRHCINLL